MKKNMKMISCVRQVCVIFKCKYYSLSLSCLVSTHSELQFFQFAMSNKTWRDTQSRNNYCKFKFSVYTKCCRKEISWYISILAWNTISKCLLCFFLTGKHRWLQRECMICTVCEECTGYGSSCINTNSQEERVPGQ